MAKSYRAVYMDLQNRTYSCPAVKTEDRWMMMTSDGLTEITHDFQDDIGGPLTFLEYREDPADDRLHIAPRQPGQSSFRQLQGANVSRVNAERKAREESRARAQEISVNPAKVEAARQINNEYAALKNRHGIKNQ